jgi:hypothetical protein
MQCFSSEWGFINRKLPIECQIPNVNSMRYFGPKTFMKQHYYIKTPTINLETLIFLFFFFFFFFFIEITYPFSVMIVLTNQDPSNSSYN